MAGEAGTAEKQNAIRREQKRKQRLGRGKKSNNTEKENIKVSRHVVGKFCNDIYNAIQQSFIERPEMPITTEFFRNVLRKGGEIEVQCAEPYGVVKINNFGIDCGIWLKSVTVFTSGGYGIKFKLVDDTHSDRKRVIVL